MSMIDYGAIGFKNGKLISTKMFTDMAETVGFSDRGCPFGGRDQSLDGNYFLILGDKDAILAFYKEELLWIEKNYWYGHIPTAKEYAEKDMYFNCCDFINWSKWIKYIGKYKVVVTPIHGIYCTYYKAQFNESNGDEYVVYFGYGVDLDWYHKTHLINYYNTNPKFLLRKLWDRLAFWK